MRRLQGALGDAYTDRQIKTVHVGGTNGKGSTCWKVAKSLEATGNKVGLFASPHISSFRERITVNGVPIEKEAVEELMLPVIHACVENDIPATFFELTTLLTMGYFNHMNVDFGVFEVGLGGRLDSTNVITPEVSVITSISLDHTKILGNTVEQIAAEKGGIIKPNVPLIVGPNVPHHVLKPMADSLQSEYVKVESAATNANAINGIVANPDYNLENVAVAKQVLDKVLGSWEMSAAVDASLNSLPACRFQKFRYYPDTQTTVDVLEQQRKQYLGGEDATSDIINNQTKYIDIVLDVAHNEDAFCKLFSKVAVNYPRLPTSKDRSNSSKGWNVTTVMGLSTEKDVESCVNHAVATSDDIAFVKAASDRAMDAEELFDHALSQKMHDEMDGKARVINSGEVEATVSDVLKRATERLSQNGETKEVIIICGSFFLMAEARAALKIPQLLDPVDLNERFTEKDVAASMAAADKKEATTLNVNKN
eukprot:CAMPEP_0197525956 /NCGR_PEP_ID=MMETSP1318-20131121/15370_1 /TAXON_ID=552666 /ORGANISM="Partenskyella glossopodia, Strain RCC365" /LENGTH=480 /DNA_ID=CAMNT_0043079827 /DNA_START=193 /DNA_END=1635 /DNA_ORIENTATION=+